MPGYRSDQRADQPPTAPPARIRRARDRSAAMSSPTPGIASADASNPNVPPIVPPAATIVPSGALVCFSCEVSGPGYRTSARGRRPQRNPPSTSSTARSARSTLGYIQMPLFLSVMLLLALWALCRGSAELIGDVSVTPPLRSLWPRRSSLLVRCLDRPLQRHVSVLSNDLHVVGVGGQRFVVHERASDFLGDLPIGGVFFLLIGGRGPFGPVARIDFRVVGRRLGSCRDHGDEQGAGDGERKNDRRSRC